MSHINGDPKARQVELVKWVSGSCHAGVFEFAGHAIVDSKDFEEVSKYRWTLSKGYARTGQLPGYPRIFLHQLVYLRQHGSLPVHPNSIDHIDRDPLNCTRENLREASQSLQLANTGVSKRNVSGYRGVSWDKKEQRWQARVNLKGKSHFLGRFANKHASACAINDFFLKHYPTVPIPNPEAEHFRNRDDFSVPPKIELRRNNTSGFKGVYWHKGKCRWDANTRLGSRLHHLGSYEKIEDAVRAVNKFHREHGIPILNPSVETERSE